MGIGQQLKKSECRNTTPVSRSQTFLIENIGAACIERLRWIATYFLPFLSGTKIKTRKISFRRREKILKIVGFEIFHDRGPRGRQGLQISRWSSTPPSAGSSAVFSASTGSCQVSKLSTTAPLFNPFELFPWCFKSQTLWGSFQMVTFSPKMSEFPS